MSGQIVIENNRLVAEQGSNVSTIIVVENDTLDNVEITAAEGVAFNFNADNGEIVLSSNTLGTHEILVGFEGEDPQDVIVLDVIEEATAPVVESPAQPAPEPVVETPPAPPAPPVEQPKPIAPVAPSAPKEAVASNVVELMGILEEYKTKMSLKGTVPVDVGVQMQGKLLRAYNKMLSKEGKDFVDNMNALVRFVKENRQDVFNERAINRFMQFVKMNKEEHQFFTRFNTLLIFTADIEDRKMVASRVDMKYIEARMKNSGAMQRLRNYYNPATE